MTARRRRQVEHDQVGSLARFHDAGTSRVANGSPVGAFDPARVEIVGNPPGYARAAMVWRYWYSTAAVPSVARL